MLLHFVPNRCLVFLTAMGSSKKAAKKAAAENMMAKLHSLSEGAGITWVCQIQRQLPRH